MKLHLVNFLLNKYWTVLDKMVFMQKTACSNPANGSVKAHAHYELYRRSVTTVNCAL